VFRVMPIRSAVTVSLVPEARGGPFVFWDDLPSACRKASALGFDAIELFAPGPEAVAPADLRKVLDEHGLQLAAVGTGAGWVKHRLTLTLPSSAERAKARDFIRAMIDFAAPFGAPAIIGSMQGRSNEEVDAATAAGYLTDALEVLGERARAQGVPLIYEPLNRYETNMANTIGQSVSLLKRLSTGHVRILADLFHMNIEESNLADAFRAGAGLIGHVHFADSNRKPIGLGHLELEQVVKALADVDYQGYISAEVLPDPDPDAAAEQTIRSFRRWFPRSG